MPSVELSVYILSIYFILYRQTTYFYVQPTPTLGIGYVVVSFLN